jgi:phospholipase C
LGNKIEHVFVLILENRSFDHMLGYSGITGVDASAGTATAVRGLNPLSLRATFEAYQQNSLSGIVRKRGQAWPPTSTRSVRSYLTANDFNGVTYGAQQGADYAMPVDPKHEFPDAVTQLAGAGSSYPPGGAYPAVVNDGFVASYLNSGSGAAAPEIMKCYAPAQLPVLNALASEFVVCDNWHAPLPGPTWPNRFFAHAASSGGLDHSPSAGEIGEWSYLDGFSFPNGTIYDCLNNANLKWNVYAGDSFPIVGALKGVSILDDISGYDDFAGDVAKADYPYAYTFIEPSYGHWTSDFKCGTSQHPLDDVTRGEQLIKATYEAIRNSPVWNDSLLIVTWDEHGGFFDHLPPPAAIAPGDTTPGGDHNDYGFTFEQYGPRVPAVVISPLIPRNLIDHRLYDHSSIPALVESCFGLPPLTRRDAASNQLLPLASLDAARPDAPTTLPPAMQSGIGGCDPPSLPSVSTQSMTEAIRPAISPALAPLPVTRPAETVDKGNLPGVLYVARRAHAALTTPAVARARASQVRTRQDAAQYLGEIDAQVRAVRATRTLTR